MVGAEISAIRTRSDDYLSSAKKTRLGIYIWGWLSLSFTVIFSAMLLVGILRAKPVLLIVPGFVFFFFIVSSLSYVVALNSYYLGLFDYCEQVIQVINENNFPVIGTGVAYPISCFEKNANSEVVATQYSL